MKREFLLNILVLVTLNVLIKPAYIFGIDRSVQNLVGEHLYGEYFAILNLTFILQIFNDLGLPNFNSRLISQNPSLIKTYLVQILMLKAWLAPIFFVVLFFVAWLLGYGQASYFIIFILGINQILLSLLMYVRSNLTGLGLYRTDSFISTLDRILLLCIMPVLIFVEPFRSNFQMWWFAVAQGSTILITASVAFFFVYKEAKPLKWTFDWQQQVKILREAYPYAITVLVMMLYMKTDAVMLERLLVADGARQAGIYASAWRLLDAANMLGYLVSGLLLPMFARQIADKVSIVPLLRLSFGLLMVIALSFAAGVWQYRSPIMHLLYDGATDYSGDVLGWLMWSFVAVTGNYVFSILFNATGQVRRLNFVLAWAILVNFSLNLLLIFDLGALGAAKATFFTQFFILFVLIYAAFKSAILSFKTDWQLLDFNKIMLFAVIALSIHWLTFTFLSGSVSWFFAFFIGCIGCFIIAFALGLMGIKNWRILLNLRKI